MVAIPGRRGLGAPLRRLGVQPPGDLGIGCAGMWKLASVPARFCQTGYGRERVSLWGGGPVRRAAAVGVAMCTIVITAVAASEGWVWAVVAWMGSSSVSFA